MTQAVAGKSSGDYKAFEQLNEAWLALEAKIRDMCVPCFVAVQFDNGRLCWGKVNGKRRLVVETARDGMVCTLPVTDVSVEMRLAASQVVGQFMQACRGTRSAVDLQCAEATERIMAEVARS